MNQSGVHKISYQFIFIHFIWFSLHFILIIPFFYNIGTFNPLVPGVH